jgi:hypothetical protein
MNFREVLTLAQGDRDFQNIKQINTRKEPTLNLIIVQVLLGVPLLLGQPLRDISHREYAEIPQVLCLRDLWGTCYIIFELTKSGLSHLGVNLYFLDL